MEMIIALKSMFWAGFIVLFPLLYLANEVVNRIIEAKNKNFAKEAAITAEPFITS